LRGDRKRRDIVASKATIIRPMAAGVSRRSAAVLSLGSVIVGNLLGWITVFAVLDLWGLVVGGAASLILVLVAVRAVRPHPSLSVMAAYGLAFALLTWPILWLVVGLVRYDHGPDARPLEQSVSAGVRGGVAAVPLRSDNCYSPESLGAAVKACGAGAASLSVRPEPPISQSDQRLLSPRLTRCHPRPW
jgi:hypothetical protein